MFLRRDIIKELQSNTDFEFINDKWVFKGKLTKSNSWLIDKAYSRWHKQGDRCNNPSHNRYKNYGRKGVKRIWNSRQFINWFVNEILKRECWDCPTESRDKDCGDYEENNCQLLERKENSKNRINLKEKVIEVLKKHNIDREIINKIKHL